MTAEAVTYTRPTYTTSNIQALDLKPGDIAYLGGQMLAPRTDIQGKAIRAGLHRSGTHPKAWRLVTYVYAETKRDGSQEEIPWMQINVETGDPLDGFTRILTLRVRPYDLVRVQRQKDQP